MPTTLDLPKEDSSAVSRQSIASANTSAVLLPGSGNRRRSSTGAGNLTHDVQKVMNIHHFEQLKEIFENEQEEESGGFPLEKFHEVFGRVFKGMLSHDDITTLFMKIDANSDGTVTWDEFSTYMMMGTINSEETTIIMEETGKILGHSPDTREPVKPHKDTIKMVQYVTREKKFVSVSQDGNLATWSFAGDHLKTLNLKEFISPKSWVTSATTLYDQGKVAIGCDDGRIFLYDLFSLKPRVLVIVGPLDAVPQCMAYHPQYDEQHDLLLWGDDSGHAHVLTIAKKFFIDWLSEDRATVFDRVQLAQRKKLERVGVKYKKRKIHNDWVTSISYVSEFSSMITTSSDPQNAFAVSSLEKKQIKTVKMSKGLRCFEVSISPTFLITGGIDKAIRLWNPYALQKPAGSLVGHQNAVSMLKMNYDMGHLISIDDSNTIMIWSMRSLRLIQTIQDTNLKHDILLSAVCFDPVGKRLVVAQDSLIQYEQYRKKTTGVKRTHESKVVGALYNLSFHQVVSSSKDTIKVWNLANGKKLFQYKDLHDGQDVTSICFDKTKRRLLTAARGGSLRMWNFNNGQMLQSMTTRSKQDLMQVIYIQTKADEKLIACAGWDRIISVFDDDPGNMAAETTREFDGYFMGSFNGHTDDILTIDYHPNRNFLASGSADGEIIIWNFSSGVVKFKLTLERAAEDDQHNAVERVKFLHPSSNREAKRCFLISGHSDGFMRVWDLDSRRVIEQYDCRSEVNAGISAIGYDAEEGNIVLVGDTCGSVMAFEFELHPKFTCKMINSWKCHLGAIGSVEYVADPSVVLTSAKDETVRVWTIDGYHVGILDPETIWDIANPSSYCQFPEDLTRFLENSPEELARREATKLQVARRFEKWNYNVDSTLVDQMEMELKELLKVQYVPADLLRERILCRVVANKWLKFVDDRRKERSHSIDMMPSQIDDVEFFKLREPTEPRKRLNLENFKHEFAFHRLPTYGIQNIEMPKREDSKNNRTSTAANLFSQEKMFASSRKNVAFMKSLNDFQGTKKSGGKIVLDKRSG